MPRLVAYPLIATVAGTRGYFLSESRVAWCPATRQRVWTTFNAIGRRFAAFVEALPPEIKTTSPSGRPSW